jgi:glycerol kinase
MTSFMKRPQRQQNWHFFNKLEVWWSKRKGVMPGAYSGTTLQVKSGGRMVIKYMAAVDQGTTSTRFALFTHDGRLAAMAQKEHRQHYPKPGWVEHDPMELWANTVELMEAVVGRHGVDPAEIGALGLTNQRETCLLWDRGTGEPLHPAIVWQDTRTAALCRELEAACGPEALRARTGLPAATYFSGPKLRWLLDKVPQAAHAVAQGRALFGTVDTWLLWKLTGGPQGGVHLTDPTNASRTLLFDLHRLDWDPELLAWAGAPRALLPEVRPSSDPALYGRVAQGPLRGIPVCGVLGDQQAALFGQACFAPGEAKNTYGTGCFLLMNTGEVPLPSTHGLLTTVACQVGQEPPSYALEGSIAIAGALVQWARDRMELIPEAGAISALAAQVPDNGGVYLVPAFSGLFAPHWRPEARGLIAGLTHGSGKAHLARAILEATAYQTRDLFAAMTADAGVALKALKVDGGMTASDLLMQFQADLLGVPVILPVVRETTALGAAYACGLAVGFWGGREELRDNWQEAARWRPAMDPGTRTRLCAGWAKAVARSLDWDVDAQPEQGA